MITQEYLSLFINESFFCAKGISVTEIINALSVIDYKRVSPDEAKLFYYPLFRDNRFDTKAKTHLTEIIISEKINEWVYFSIHWGHFNGIKSVIEKLLLKNTIELNYYYGDMCVDSCLWILSRNNKIYREFEYAMMNIYTNIGDSITDIETKFINNITNNINSNEDFIVIDSVVNDIICHTGNHYELLNTFDKKLTECTIGYYEIDLQNL